MKMVICGLPFSGKSTVFRALVGKQTHPRVAAGGKLQLNIGTLEWQDERLQNLGRILHSEKITYPKISLIDLVHLGEREGLGFDATHIKEFDCLSLVIAVFSSKDPLGDLNNIGSELILADLQVIQSRIEKINKERKAKPQKEETLELVLLKHCAQALEEEHSLKRLQLSQDELKALAGFQLLTLKPMIVIANLSESQLNQGQERELEKMVKAQKLPFFSLCAELEAEIEELSEEERPQFLKEMGLSSLSRDRFIQLCFQAQDALFFFTVVGKEARAWPIIRGTTAIAAAGCVHSDMQRGFIRAEVINYKDFVACGSFAQAKEKGLLRLESKEYPVQDGDIINFKFSV